MTHMPQISRRFFLTTAAAAGGGLALGFHLPTDIGQAAAAAGPVEVNAWVVIQPDDAVIIRVARSEMGQGITTSLPMLVAEELNATGARCAPNSRHPRKTCGANARGAKCRPAAAGRCGPLKNISAKPAPRRAKC